MWKPEVDTYTTDGSFQTVCEFEAAHLKKQKPRTLCFIAQGDHRKIIKEIKQFCVICATGKAKEPEMAHNNKYLLLGHGGHY